MDKSSKKRVAPPSAAQRQREYREKMKASGYTARVVWLPSTVKTPDFADILPWALKQQGQSRTRGRPSLKIPPILSQRETEALITASIRNSRLQAVSEAADFIFGNGWENNVFDFINTAGFNVEEVLPFCSHGQRMATLWKKINPELFEEKNECK